jgi:hypothetical protein
MTNDSGWVSYSPNSISKLPQDVQQQVRMKMADRLEESGGLLAVVQVRVFENDEVVYVSFPPGSMLGPETENAVISEVVARAHAQLASWR